MLLPIAFMLALLWVGAALGGGLMCLAGMTDPNIVPNRLRQSLFPIGAGLAFGAVSLLVGAVGGAAIGSVLYGANRPLSDIVPLLTGLVGGSVGGVVGAVVGFFLGRMRNRRFWEARARGRE